MRAFEWVTACCVCVYGGEMQRERVDVEGGGDGEVTFGTANG